MRTLLNREETESIIGLMRLAIMAYNNSVHSSTNFTPFELIFGHSSNREPFDMYYDKRFYTEYVNNHKNRLKVLYERISDQIQNQKEKVITKRNENSKNIELRVGQEVYVKLNTRSNKTSYAYQGPYKLHKINDDNTAIVIDNKNKTRKVHIKNLKRGIVPASSDVESTASGEPLE